MNDGHEETGPGDRKPHERGPRIAQIATRQFGVISLEQLRATGLTDDELRGRVREGHLHPLHRGVYIVGHRRVVDHAYLIAALLATGPDPFLSHRTSAAVRGLRRINIRNIDVSVVSTGRANRRGITVHATRTPPHKGEVTTWNGLRVSSVPRMLVELAPREPRKELNRLITESVRRKLLDVAAIDETLERYAGRPGIVKLRDALAAYRPKPNRRSNLEHGFDDALAARPDIPQPMRNVRLGPWEIDCYWPQQRVALELDGRDYHIAAQDFEKDRLKDAWLQRRNIRILRVTDFRFEHDRAAVFDDLLALLRLAA